MWYVKSASDQLFGILLYQANKSVQQQLLDNFSLYAPHSKEKNYSKTALKWSVNVGPAEPLTKSTALWVPRGDHKQPPPLPIRRGHKGKNIPDFLRTFRFMTPTSCPSMFAFLSSKRTSLTNLREPDTYWRYSVSPWKNTHYSTCDETNH